MTAVDVLFAVAVAVSAVGFVGVVLFVCWLAEPEPAHPADPDEEITRYLGPDRIPVSGPRRYVDEARWVPLQGYRIVRRPFDWSTHPDL